jgi:hypothetical protein
MVINDDPALLGQVTVNDVSSPKLRIPNGFVLEDPEGFVQKVPEAIATAEKRRQRAILLPRSGQALSPGKGLRSPTLRAFERIHGWLPAKTGPFLATTQGFQAMPLQLRSDPGREGVQPPE